MLIGLDEIQKWVEGGFTRGTQALATSLQRAPRRAPVFEAIPANLSRQAFAQGRAVAVQGCALKGTPGPEFSRQLVARHNPTLSQIAKFLGWSLGTPAHTNTMPKPWIRPALWCIEGSFGSSKCLPPLATTASHP